MKCESFASDLRKAVQNAPQKRQIVLKFLSTDVPVTVSDPSLEVNLRIQAAVTSIALECGALPCLKYESWLLAPPREDQEKIEKSALENALNCRTFAAEILSDKRIASFEDMRSTLLKNSQALCSMDGTFRLELSFLEGPAEDQIREAVSIAELKKEECLKIGPPGLTSLVTSVEEVVCGIMKGTSPDAGLAKTSGFFKEVMLRLPFFLQEMVTDEAGNQKKLGAKLLSERFVAVKGKHEKDPGSLHLKKKEQFQGFQWLSQGVKKTT